MADESSMALVAVAEHDRIAEFTSHLAVIADGRCCNTIAEDLRSAADCDWPDEMCERSYYRAAAYEDWSRRRIEHDLGTDLGSLFHENAVVTNSGCTRFG